MYNEGGYIEYYRFLHPFLLLFLFSYTRFHPRTSSSGYTFTTCYARLFSYVSAFHTFTFCFASTSFSAFTLAHLYLCFTCVWFSTSSSLVWILWGAQERVEESGAFVTWLRRGSNVSNRYSSSLLFLLFPPRFSCFLRRPILRIRKIKTQEIGSKRSLDRSL